MLQTIRITLLAWLAMVALAPALGQKQEAKSLEQQSDRIRLHSVEMLVY